MVASSLMIHDGADNMGLLLRLRQTVHLVSRQSSNRREHRFDPTITSAFHAGLAISAAPVVAKPRMYTNSLPSRRRLVALHMERNRLPLSASPVAWNL